MKKTKFVEKWKRFATKLGRFQTNVIMTVIYFLIVPFFSLMRLSDPLKLRLNKNADSYWEPKKEIDTSLESMRELH